MKDANEIRLQFERDYLACDEQRDQANEDVRFITVPGGHWEGFLEDHYADKPKMQYDLTNMQVKRFMGEWSTNEVMPKFRVEGDDDSKAELYDGMFRGSWRKSGGSNGAKNAVFEVSAGGFGAIRIGTRHVDEFDIEDDRQEVTFSPIFSAYSTVVFDANAKQIDKRDARHVSLIWEYTKEEFEEKWPDKAATSATTIDDRRNFSWSNKDSVFVIEHYEKVEKKGVVHLFMNALHERHEVDDKDLADAEEELSLLGYERVKSRKVKRIEILKSIISGDEFLEEPRRIAGKILPIIPFYGFWAQVDGQEHYYGLVREQKDPQRILDMEVSKLAEISATSSKEAPIFDPDQVSGPLAARWDNAHLGKYNYHLAKALRDGQGNIIQTGPIGYVRPPQIDPATQGLIDFTTTHIRSTAGGMPQDVEDPDASGKAILAVQKRVDLHTYTIMDNIAAGMRRLGEAFISIAEEILQDNRKVLTISEGGSEKEVQINQALVESGKIVHKNKITSKGVEVYSVAGPSFQSQRRETVEFLKELIGVLPPEDPRSGAVISGIVENMEGTGLTQIKDLNRKQMLLSGLVEPEGEEEEQLVAQAQQSQEDPQGMQALIESQVALNMAEAQGQEATNIDKIASAEKKQAEAAKIIQSIGIEKTRLILDALDKEQQALAQ